MEQKLLEICRTSIGLVGKNFILPVQETLWRKIVLSRKKFLRNFFQNLSKCLGTRDEKVSARLSKQHSTCPRDHIYNTIFSRKVNKLVIFIVILMENFPDSRFKPTRVLKPAFSVHRVTKFFFFPQNRNVVVLFRKSSESFRDSGKKKDWLSYRACDL